MKTNKLIIIVLGMLIITATSCKKDESFNVGDIKPDGTVTDIDGNIYHTVKIGNQTWMVENYKATKFRNNDAIPLITDYSAWINNDKSAYCDYNNYPYNSIVTGRLYNGYLIQDSRQITPKGWHVPTKDDFDLLIANLGGSTAAANKLKEAGADHWEYPNADATNSSGFTLLPCGRSYSNLAINRYADYSTYSILWTSTRENQQNYALFISTNKYSNIQRMGDEFGHAIRLIKD